MRPWSFEIIFRMEWKTCKERKKFFIPRRTQHERHDGHGGKRKHKAVQQPFGKFRHGCADCEKHYHFGEHDSEHYDGVRKSAIATSVFLRLNVRRFLRGVLVLGYEKVEGNAEKPRDSDKHGYVRYRFGAFPLGNGFIRIVYFFGKLRLRKFLFATERDEIASKDKFEIFQP